MTRLTLEDWRAFERVAMRQYHEKSTTTRAVYSGLFIAFGFAAAWLSDWLDSPLQLLGVFLGAALAWLSVWLTARAVRKSYVPDDDGAFLGEHAYELDAEGIRANRPGSSSLSSWSVVKAVSVTAEHLFIWLDKIHAFVVPLRSLPAGVGRDELIRHVERWWGSSVVPEAQRSATSRAQAAHDPAPVGCDASAHPGNLRSSGWTTTLLCLLTLRRTDAPGKVSVGVLALLTGLACGAWIGVDWLRNQPDPEFYSYGVPVFAWYALIALAITAVLARNSKPALDWQRVLAVVLAATPPLIVGSYLIDRFLSWPWTLVASLALLVYLIGYAVRALSALSGARQPQALVSGIFVTLLLLWVTDWLYVEPSVWLAADAEAEDGAGYETAWKEAEPLLFSQAARIDEAIGAIEASSAGTPAVFFVGFAGYAEERVFAEEIKLATRVVGERYGTQARSVLLINDRRSLDAQPLASPTALRHALRGLATKMNTERDVLFLALSSHGSVDSLSVSNAPLMLQDLAATDLASALQESGIKWRVIAISACHAGSFIDELRNANTIVITASAAEKTSFGCSDERDLTYFGEAFYRDALPRAKSLRDAFELAKADIGAREKHEDIEASDPQAFFGEEIERHLATLP